MPQVARSAVPVVLSLLAACSGGRTDGGGTAGDSSAVRSPDTVAAPAPPRASTARACGLDTGVLAVLSGEGVGAVRVGASVAQVRDACEVRADTTVPGSEGMRERMLVVGIGADSVRALVSGDSIRRVHVASPAIRTVDSLGVGSTVAALRRAGARVLVGEGTVFVTLPDHCGLSFRLGEPVRFADVVRQRESARLAALPGTARVTEVLAIGCQVPRAA